MSSSVNRSDTVGRDRETVMINRFLPKTKGKKRSKVFFSVQPMAGVIVQVNKLLGEQTTAIFTVVKSRYAIF